MDNHPIPQDVTGFQFKLFGNMTVKQFAYLATGIVFAWILLQLPVNILIKFPFCAFSAILGLGLAFFPISGRPMDLMIGNYIKALFRPTQFVYEKIGGQIYFPNKMPTTAMRSVRQYKSGFSPFPKDKLKTYLESLNALPKNKVDEKENNFLMSISGLAAGTVSHPANTASNLNIPQVSLQPTPAAYPGPQKTLSDEPIVKATPIRFSTSTVPLVKPAEPVKLTRPTGAPSAPDSPNVITGITRDARGNPLSNILVEVKDKDGNPVRAFKTNELGRFASATPLINGNYFVEFEDPKAQNRFEKTTINVAGQIVSPIEAISVDTREELRRSLFSAN